MPEHAEQMARKELDRLSHMAPSSAEYTVSRTYLDWLVTLPWSNSTVDKLDLKAAKKVLDEDHHDLAGGGNDGSPLVGLDHVPGAAAAATGEAREKDDRLPTHGSELSGLWRHRRTQGAPVPATRSP